MRRRSNTSVDFTAQTRTLLQISRVIQTPKTNAEAIQRVSWLWAKTFQLPPNDQRFLSLNLREAIEQVLAVEALEDLRRGGEATRLPQEGPALTGDPIWDAMELAEYDPANQVG